MTRATTLTAALLLLGLAACGRGDLSVRNGPQAVHPSPSALAQGTAVTTAQPAPVAAAPIYTPTANDGSQPIID